MSSYSASRTPAETRVAKCQLHGVLLQVYGRGVLLLGESGVGKTVCALELMERGHALIADDAVQVFEAGKRLTGRAPEATRSLVNVRTIGITNVLELFEPTAIGDECTIDISIEICEAIRIPSIYRRHPFLRRRLPYTCIPADTSDRTADLIEAIVRKHTDTRQRLLSSQLSDHSI